MELYHILFFLLKIIVGVHLTLIIFKVVPEGNIYYLLNESFFKLCIGIFLGFYFLLSNSSGLSLEDRTIISIAGFVILYDIHYVEIFNRFPELWQKGQ